MRLALILPFVLFACADSHGNDEPDASGTDASSLDAATDTTRRDAGMCLHDGPHPLCARDCASDGLIPAICVDDNWLCPPGSIDTSTCTTDCPDGINPWDRDAPASACTTEGATCSEGTQCGSGLFCRCESGAWDCAVAEPDPACWCEREPQAGGPCTGEVAECGQCCPTAEGPNWSPMSCVDNTWQPVACEEIVCPEVLLECPVEIDPLLGTPCVHEAQSCGEPCCGSVQCRDGVWQQGPILACACQQSPACGRGSCTLQQSCNSRCGPDDGVEFRCVALPADCNSCECVTLQPGQGCEMVEGYVRVFENEICG